VVDEEACALNWKLALVDEVTDPWMAALLIERSIDTGSDGRFEAAPPLCELVDPWRATFVDPWRATGWFVDPWRTTAVFVAPWRATAFVDP
jgi:hypothetical protein